MLSALVASLVFSKSPTDVAVDAFVESVPAAETRSIKALASYLSGVSPLPELRLQAAFRWITRNIRYDDEGLRIHKEIRDPALCLSSRRGVCEGVASLLVALCKPMGISVDMVTGEARSLTWKDRKPISTYELHAWNRVRLGGQTFWFDPTWSLGQKAEDPIEEGYWRVRPNEMRFSHLVDRDNQRPNEPCYPKSSLAKAPVWRGGLAQYVGLEMPSIPNNIGSEGVERIPISVKGSPTLFANDLEGGVDRNRDSTLISYQDGACELLFVPQKAGWHSLNIHGWPSARSTYPVIAQFPVFVPKVSSPVPLPKPYENFDSDRIGLITGTQGIFSANEIMEFAITAPGAKRVAFAFPDNPTVRWREFRKVGDDLWEYAGTFPAGKWVICRDDPEKFNSYVWLLEYQVTAASGGSPRS